MQSESDIHGETYRTGQVLAGCWEALLPDSAEAGLRANPSSAFTRRLHRLAESDVGVPGSPGSGTDLAWGLYNACEMSFALELWDRGFNALDVEFIVRHSRGELQGAFEYVVDRALPFTRAVWLLKDRPRLPPRLWLPGEKGDFGNERRRTEQADRTVWAVFRAHEMREMWHTHDPAIPFFTQIKWFAGLRELVKYLDGVTHREGDRGSDLIEVSGMFARTVRYVRAAPLKRRGRP